MAVMQEDVTNLGHGLMMIPSFTFNVITILVCLGYMMHQSLILFLVVVVGLVVTSAIVKILTKILIPNLKKLRENLDSFFSNIEAINNGGKEIHLNKNRRQYFHDNEVSPILEKIRKSSTTSQSIIVLYNSFTGVIFFLLIGVIVYGSSKYLPNMEINIIISFVLLIMYIVPPLKDIASISGEIAKVRVSLKKIDNLELEEVDKFTLTDSETKELIKKKVNSIHFKNVCFKYSKTHENKRDDFFLGPITLTVKSGEITFITGGNGSGKSTFVKLLTGLYPPQSGNIYVNDELLGESMSQAQYKNYFSTIFSDFALFQQLLDEKGNPADDSIIMDYLKVLKLDEKLQSKNGILSTMDLSQGQKKRIALLQSYLENAPICVYDEWAADQDPVFKKYFYSKLLPELKLQGKIVVIISHDDNYFHLADKFIKFEAGKITKI
ncbi:putative pyoverdin transport system ATP-binding/permease protein [Marinicellulosiphila megalodicopiae]